MIIHFLLLEHVLQRYLHLAHPGARRADLTEAW